MFKMYNQYIKLMNGDFQKVEDPNLKIQKIVRLENFQKKQIFQKKS